MSQAHTITVPGAVRAVLADGKRRHFQHGPIDLVLEAFGPDAEVAAFYEGAWARFRTVLGELVGELAALRTGIADMPAVRGNTARRMAMACAPHRDSFVTPMAAVAGAVADDVLAAGVAGRSLARAYVNNGGDIAIHLAPGERFRTGMVALAEVPDAAGVFEIGSEDGVGGIATSGWRGRSLSLGIADSVTVLAENAAEADVAATLIANSVDTDSAAVIRSPASELDPDSDLGNRPVTVDVGDLTKREIATALASGRDAAQSMADRGLIAAASLTLCGSSAIAAKMPVAVSPAIEDFSSFPENRAEAA